IGIINEADEHERRVAATPQVTQLLNKPDVAWLMEKGAGAAAGYPDSEYSAQKFSILPSAEAVFSEADIIFHISPVTLRKVNASSKKFGRRII
ncbi:hypothetical protein ACW4UO_32605, partial [Klebsiella pneumoniae]